MLYMLKHCAYQYTYQCPEIESGKVCIYVVELNLNKRAEDKTPLSYGYT